MQEQSARLVAAMAAGEAPALTRLIALQGRGLTLFAARYLGNPEEGEEVVQDVFLRAWRHAGAYDPGRAAVSTWLYRIALGLCIDRHRRMRIRRWFGGGGAEPDEMADDGPGAEQGLAVRQELAMVRRAIAALPARQRQAILLGAVAGMDRAAIAATMGASEGAVEQLMVRARRSLRAELGRGETGDAG